MLKEGKEVRTSYNGQKMGWSKERQLSVQVKVKVSQVFEIVPKHPLKEMSINASSFCLTSVSEKCAQRK